MSANEYPNPLTSAHCDCLDRVLSKTAEAIALIEACKDCGWDFSAALEELNTWREQATRTKAKFFPGRV